MSERPNPFVIGDGREVRVMETLVQSAPLGLRCWDSVLDRPVSDGLVVHATPVAGGATTRARRSSSGVFGFTSLPTTRAAERRSVAEFPAPETYTVDIFDRLTRFVPIRVLVDAPTAFADPAPIVLFPSANRPTPDGFAAVRSTVRIERTSIPAASGRRVRPAPHAVLIVTVEGVDHIGVADRSGEAVVFVPFDRFAAGVAPNRQTRNGALTVRFDPALSTPDAPLPVFADIAAQPVRAHLEGPVFRPDHTFAIGFGSDISLTSPGWSELMLQAI